MSAFDEEVRQQFALIGRRIVAIFTFIIWNLVAAWLGPFLVAIVWFVPYELSSQFSASEEPLTKLWGLAAASAILAGFSAVTFSGLGVLLFNVVFWSADKIYPSARTFAVLVLGGIIGSILLSGMSSGEGLSIGAVFAVTTAVTWLIVRKGVEDWTKMLTHSRTV